MCEFSHKYSKLVTLTESKALNGHRFWYWDFRKDILTSMYQKDIEGNPFEYKEKLTISHIPDLNGDLGLYSYNNYINNNSYNNYNNYNNYNYYYNYNNSYNNYIYYNNYINYNNSYNNYNNNYNYYNNYIILGLVKNFGKLVRHTHGQRAQKMLITAFLTLKDHKDKKFLEHFNSEVTKCAEKFMVPTIPFQNGDDISKLRIRK